MAAHPSLSSPSLHSLQHLSISQARAVILGYELSVLYSNGSASLISVSTAEPSSQYVHDKMMWRLTSPLKDVSSVNISAYSALGATNRSSLVIPSAGIKTVQTFIKVWKALKAPSLNSQIGDTCNLKYLSLAKVKKKML